MSVQVAGAEGPLSFAFGPGKTDVVRIGRNPKSQVPVPLPGASWCHAELRLRRSEDGNPELVIRDCSSNGTGLRTREGAVQRLAKKADTLLPADGIVILPMTLKAGTCSLDALVRLCCLFQAVIGSDVPEGLDKAKELPAFADALDVHVQNKAASARGAGRALREALEEESGVPAATPAQLAEGEGHCEAAAKPPAEGPGAALGLEHRCHKPGAEEPAKGADTAPGASAQASPEGSRRRPWQRRQQLRGSDPGIRGAPAPAPPPVAGGEEAAPVLATLAADEDRATAAEEAAPASPPSGGPAGSSPSSRGLAGAQASRGAEEEPEPRRPEPPEAQAPAASEPWGGDASDTLPSSPLSVRVTALQSGLRNPGGPDDRPQEAPPWSRLSRRRTGRPKAERKWSEPPALPSREDTPAAGSRPTLAPAPVLRLEPPAGLAAAQCAAAPPFSAVAAAVPLRATVPLPPTSLLETFDAQVGLSQAGVAARSPSFPHGSLPPLPFSPFKLASVVRPPLCGIAGSPPGACGVAAPPPPPPPPYAGTTALQPPQPPLPPPRRLDFIEPTGAGLVSPGTFALAEIPVDMMLGATGKAAPAAFPGSGAARPAVLPGTLLGGQLPCSAPGLGTTQSNGAAPPPPPWRRAAGTNGVGYTPPPSSCPRPWTSVAGQVPAALGVPAELPPWKRQRQAAA